MRPSKWPKIPDRYRIDHELHPNLPVFSAYDAHAGRTVVLKFGAPKSFLLSEHTRNFHGRLSCEAELLRRWSRCPNVVRLLDACLEHSPPFLVLEKLGPSVETDVPQHGLELDAAIVVIRDVATALVQIHRLGDAHYDLKPENFLRHPDTDRWTLIDPGEEDLRTVEYTSDCLRGWEADILALGRTFVVLLTGTIDSELDEYERESIASELGGDALLKLLNGMLGLPQLRRRHRRKRPTAQAVLRILNAVAAERAAAF